MAQLFWPFRVIGIFIPKDSSKCGILQTSKELGSEEHNKDNMMHLDLYIKYGW